MGKIALTIPNVDRRCAFTIPNVELLNFFLKTHVLNFKSANFKEFLLCFSFKILMSSTIKIELGLESH